MALSDKSSIVIPKGFYGKANVLQGFNPQTENLVDLDVVRNTTATRINEQGLIESVAANVPRRDFLNGGCGELLVEPQRTNLVTTNDFTDGDWFKIDLTATLAGVKNGFTFYDLNNDSGANSRITFLQSLTSGNSYYFSAFFDLSETTSDFVSVQVSLAADNAVISLNVSTLALTDNGATQIIAGSPTATLISNNIYRVSFGYAATSTGVAACRYRASNAGSGATSTTIGESTHVAFPQLEEGTYPTSYIPTTTAAVTRNQDVILASNIGSLLNDAEGGVYFHGAYFDLATVPRISIGDNTLSNYVALGIQSDGRFFGNLIKGGATQADIRSGAYTNNDFVKQAIRYAPNNYAYYANGTQLGTDNTVDTFANNTLNNLKLDIQSDTLPFFGRIRELIVFNNAPTDTELQTITTP